MAINGYTSFNSPTSSCGCAPPQCCPDKFGCPCGVCPDFEIRRHDTQPPYRVSVSDCNGPIDLTGCIAEVSMWALAKIKKALAPTDTYFALADDIGFEQVNVGDIIVVDRVRNPEQMIVTGFDETNKFIQVQRGYNGSQAQACCRGQKIRIFRVLNAVAETSTVTTDITDVNTGDTTFGVVTDAQLIYNWQAIDTCMPGCYWLEFKLLKMTSNVMLWPDIIPLKIAVSVINSVSIIPSVIPSFIPNVVGCELGNGVEWQRRFPLDGEGFLIKINDSATAENVI
jgi:hypothetical protein